MALKQRHKDILQALIDLGGQATLRQISEQTGLAVNGLSQSIGSIREYAALERLEGPRNPGDYLHLKLVADWREKLSEVRGLNLQPRPVPLTSEQINAHAMGVWEHNSDGLNQHAAAYLQACLKWIYSGYVLSDSNHPPHVIRDGEARIVEQRARRLASEHPLQPQMA